MMPMPETAMDENSRIIFPEDNIRRAWKVPCINPETEAKRMKGATDNKFGAGIAATDGSHHAAPGFLADGIRHISPFSLRICLDSAPVN